MRNDHGQALLKGILAVNETAMISSDIAIMDAAKHADICYKLRTETFPAGNMIKDRLTLALIKSSYDAEKDIPIGELDLHRFEIKDRVSRLSGENMFHAHRNHLLEIYNRIFDGIFPYELEDKTVSIHGFGKYFDTFLGTDLPRMESYHTHLQEASILKDLTRKL